MGYKSEIAEQDRRSINRNPYFTCDKYRLICIFAAQNLYFILNHKMKLYTSISYAMLAAALLFTSCNSSETAVKEEPKADFTQVIPTLKAITADWNKGDLDEFITVYDSAATFMLPKGPIGVNEMKGYY